MRRLGRWAAIGGGVMLGLVLAPQLAKPELGDLGHDLGGYKLRCCNLEE